MDEMGEAYNMDKGQKKFIQNFRPKNWRED